MNSKRQNLIRALLLTGALALTAPQAAMALTPACTTIINRATVSYDVGGVPQTPIDSLDGNHANANTATTFNVGVKVNFVVTRTGGITSVVPGDKNQSLNFTVTNTGNATMKFGLSATAKATGTANPFGGGLTDKFDAAKPDDPTSLLPAEVWVDGAAASSITLAPTDPAKTVIINGSIPLSRVNDDLAVYVLKAQAQWVGNSADVTTEANAAGNVIGSGGVNAACVALGGTTVEVVLADPASTIAGDDAVRDGAHSARSAYKVVTAGLTITKSSSVYWDPINGLAPAAKAIPGAVVTYTVSIANTGAVDATNIQVVDDLTAMVVTSTNLTFGNVNEATLSYNDGVLPNCAALGAGYGIKVDNVCKTNAYAGLDGASWNDPADPAVTGLNNRVVASGITVAAGATKTVQYQVTIQ